jgi:hypothetical protein
MKLTPLQIIERELLAAPFSAHPATVFSYASGLLQMASVTSAITDKQAADLERRLHAAETDYWNRRLGRMA